MSNPDTPKHENQPNDAPLTENPDGNIEPGGQIKETQPNPARKTLQVNQAERH